MNVYFRQFFKQNIINLKINIQYSECIFNLSITQLLASTSKYYYVIRTIFLRGEQMRYHCLVTDLLSDIK